MESLVMLDAYYKDKKVFITGHTGFKGAWLMACLHLAGAKIRGYALEPEYTDSLYAQLHPHIAGRSIIADIRDKDYLQKEIESFQPDFIFHLAAQPLVRRSYEIPAETFEINVAGTANVLEAAGKLPGKCTIIVITTDKVYENKERDILYNESDVLGGYDPYSASKAAAELVVSSFRNSFFNPASYANHKKAIASVRAGNVIGGGDWSKDRIIPDIISSLQNEKPVIVRNPLSVRPWQHVLEPLKGYLQLGKLLDNDAVQFSKAYNMGPEANDHLPVKELVDTAIQGWGSGGWVDGSDKSQPHEAGLLKLDISKAKKELQWKPRLKSKEAIQWTINWYKQPKENQVEYTFQQIKDYSVL